MRLSGTIPDVGNMSLRHLFAFNTRFSGTLASNFGSSFSRLANVLLGDCNISGSLPASVVDMSYLTNFDMSNCQLRGDLSILTRLIVTEDTKTGQSSLTTIHFQNNGLSGKTSTTPTI